MTQAKKILYFGAAGQVGQALRQAKLPLGLSLLPVTRKDVDITNAKAVIAKLVNERPDIVINGAAMTNVDLCEKEEELSRAVNFEAAAYIAGACSTIDVPLIHLSTDYVFDGEKKTPYLETDEPDPLSQYGFTKLLGEEAVKEDLPWHVILRVSWVFGQFGENVLPRTLKLLTGQKDVKMVSDQTTRPTPAADLANTLIAISLKILGGKADGFGTFHYCGTPNTTRFEFAQAVAEELKRRNIRSAALAPCLSKDFPTPAERPLYSALDCSKIERVYGIKQPDWKAALQTDVGKLLETMQLSGACA